MPTITIELRVFGKLTDILPDGRLELPIGTSVSALRAILEREHPALRDTSYRVAVDHLLAPADHILAGQPVVALLPPFSGG